MPQTNLWIAFFQQVSCAQVCSLHRKSRHLIRLASTIITKPITKRRVYFTKSDIVRLKVYVTPAIINGRIAVSWFDVDVPIPAKWLGRPRPRAQGAARSQCEALRHFKLLNFARASCSCIVRRNVKHSSLNFDAQIFLIII